MATQTITRAVRPVLQWVMALAIAVALFGAGLGIALLADGEEVAGVTEVPTLTHQDDFVTRHLKCVPDLP